MCCFSQILWTCIVHLMSVEMFVIVSNIHAVPGDKRIFTVCAERENQNNTCEGFENICTLWPHQTMPLNKEMQCEMCYLFSAWVSKEESETKKYIQYIHIVWVRERKLFHDISDELHNFLDSEVRYIWLFLFIFI